MYLAKREKTIRYHFQATTSSSLSTGGDRHRKGKHGAEGGEGRLHFLDASFFAFIDSQKR